MDVWHTVVPTSLGDLTVARDDAGLRGVYFPGHRHRPAAGDVGPRRDDGFDVVALQLSEYLDGRRTSFDVVCSPVGGSEFQRRVWDLIAAVPYGRTTTYGALAARLGGGAVAQQVGGAVGRNPRSVVVPCHRVVGAGGRLTGYAGGMERKAFLLDLEAAHSAHGGQLPLPG